MIKVNAPNLHLFAFQLYTATNLIGETWTQEQDFLWNSGDTIVNAIVGKDLQIKQQIDVNKSPDVSKVDLLKKSVMIIRR